MHYFGTANNDLTEIVLTFSVRGNSFLPADRIFRENGKEAKTKTDSGNQRRVLPKSFHNTEVL